jgi:hypothetical protein
VVNLRHTGRGWRPASRSPGWKTSPPAVRRHRSWRPAAGHHRPAHDESHRQHAGGVRYESEADAVEVRRPHPRPGGTPSGGTARSTAARPTAGVRTAGGCGWRWTPTAAAFSRSCSPAASRSSSRQTTCSTCRCCSCWTSELPAGRRADLPPVLAARHRRPLPHPHGLGSPHHHRLPEDAVEAVPGSAGRRQHHPARSRCRACGRFPVRRRRTIAAADVAKQFPHPASSAAVRGSGPTGWRRVRRAVGGRVGEGC